MSIAGCPSTTIWTSMQIPCKMSTGSNPVTTPGVLNSSTKKSKGAKPVMVATCPGRIKPSIVVSGSLAMARSAGGVVLWAQ